MLLSALLALLTLASLVALLVTVRWTLRQATSRLSESSKDLAATTSAISGILMTTLDTVTESQTKMFQAMNSLVRETMSGASSAESSRTKQMDALIALLASKDPMAYSQVRQTNAAIPDADDPSKPYDAVDDAAEAEARAKFLADVEEQRTYLAQQGINIQET
jgi:hypothetical protein